MNLKFFQTYTALKLFVLFILLYMMSMTLIHFLQLYLIGTSYVYVDEKAYFGLSFFYVDYQTLPELVDIRILDRFYVSSLNVYYHMISSYGYLLDFFGLNSFYTQKLISVFFAALSIPYIYLLQKKTLINYDEKVFIQGTIIFGFMPFMLLFSSVLLRDIVIMFFSIYTLYHVFNTFVFKYESYLKIIIALSIIFSLRKENFLILFVSLIIIYIFHYKNTIINHFKNIFSLNKYYRWIIYSIIFLIGILIFLGLYDVVNLAIHRVNAISNRAMELAREDSLGKIIFNMPFFLNVLLKGFFSQLLPFPMWRNIEQTPAFVILIFNGFIWFSIFCLSLIGITFKKYRKVFSYELLLIYVFSIIYIILVSNGELNLRRLFIMYPFIFIIGYVTFLNFTKIEKIYFVVAVIVLHLLLHIIYLLIKYNV